MSSRTRTVVTTTASLAVVVAMAVLVWSTVTTSSARVAATTESVGFFSAGTVELSTPTSAQNLLFDADGLYPGVEIEGCVELDYVGSIPGTIKLFAEPVGGTGLDRYIDFVVEVSSDPAGCDGFRPDRVVFDGTLERFWRTHDSYGSGLALGEGVASGSRLALRGVATMQNANEAQGLTIDFSMMVEVRP